MKTNGESETARCPSCGHGTATKSGSTARAWYCHECRLEFEPEDDGDIGYGRPEKRLEREERAQLQARARRNDSARFLRRNR